MATKPIPVIELTPIKQEDFRYEFLGFDPNHTPDGFTIFPDMTFERLMAPSVDAQRINQGTRLRINCVVPIDLIEGNTIDQKSDFDLYSLLSRNTTGALELIIFIRYHNPGSAENDPKQVQTFSVHGFQIVLEIDPILNEKEGNMLNPFVIPGETIQTIKVFQRNTNPKTSRGTETTVQEGG